MQDYPHPPEEGRMEIIPSILLTLVTCGIYGLYWQYRQMETLNAWLGERKYDFWMYFLLSIVTCGIYAIYMEYVMARDINQIQKNYDKMVNDDLAVICLVMSILGLSLVSLAIQQKEINDFYQERI